MNRLVIDTDPGVDDAHAIMMAYAHPNARVEAICTVAGNVGLDRTTANACTILDVLGIAPEQTPIFAGCDRPLMGSYENAAEVHGKDGLGNSNHPQSGRKVESEHAVLALIRLANEATGELTLVALGPLTNVALATKLDPSLPTKYKRLVIMGGAIRGTGNMYNASAEFNILTDPEAAHIVFEHWRGLCMLSWETTMDYMLLEERVNELMNAGTSKSDFIRRITEQTVIFVREKLGRPGLFMPDPLAMAAALEPQTVTKMEHRAVSVELTGKHTRGQTTVDWFGLTGKPPSVDVILEVDFDKFWTMMKAAVL